MSWASKYLFRPIEDAFATAVQMGGPNSAPAAQTAAANLGQAQGLVEQSITALATIAVNAVLALVPKGQGSALAPLADAFLAEVIDQLTAHQANAVSAPDAPASGIGGTPASPA